jgi:transposase
MVRVGEDVGMKLDIVPAESSCIGRIHAKRACRCCQTLKQAPAEAEIFDVRCLSVAIELRRVRTQVATA